MIKLSDTTKLSCKAFGLPSCTTCPIKGQICQVCYAHYGMARMENVHMVLKHNQDLIDIYSVTESANSIAQQLEGERYFRWFWSGDCYSEKMRQVVVETAKLTPHVKHWIATRTANSFKAKNIIVRRSSVKVNDETIKGLTSTVFTPEYKQTNKGIWECPGSCDGCRVCWESDSPVAYRFHGSGSARAILRKLQKEGKMPV